MDMAVFPTDEVDQFDELAHFLESSRITVIQTDDGSQARLPNEVVDVVRQAVEFFARGKAVIVTPQSRARFL